MDKLRLQGLLQDKWWDFKDYIEEVIDIVRWWWKRWLIGSLILLTTLYVSFAWVLLEKENIKVTDKDIKVVEDRSTGDREDVYYLYTDSIAYQLKDNLFYLRTRSADDYGHITVGRCYVVWSIGVRFGWNWEMCVNIIYFVNSPCR